MIKPRVWLQAGVVAVYGASLDAKSHCHHAIQVIWPAVDAVCLLNEIDIEGVTFIGSGEPHQLQMSAGWVLLVEPKSELGHAFERLLAGQSFKTFSSLNACLDIPKQGGKQEDEKEPALIKFLLPLFDGLNLNSHYLHNNHISIKDRRIQQVVAQLESCLHSDGIQAANWRASEIAQQVALSEGRFLHLFSQELGIAWRPYLLWRRMNCAVQAIISHHNATDAAHLAGFSDSAHLSRTFKRTFGMTIRQALALFKKT